MRRGQVRGKKTRKGEQSKVHWRLNDTLLQGTVPAMKRAHELEEPILSQLLGLEKNQAYHVYADPWAMLHKLFII